MRRVFKETFDEVKVASPLKRLGALLYDGMLVIALWMVLGAAAVALNQGEAVEGPLFRSVLFLATFGFFAFFWTRSGQTLGMLAWRLRVQTVNGEALSLTQALTRFFGAILSLVCFGLGFIWAFFHRERLTWHDILSNSCVVELPKKDKNKK